MSASGRPNIFCIVIFVTCPFKETSIIVRKTRLKRWWRHASMKSNSSPRVVSDDHLNGEKNSEQLYIHIAYNKCWKNKELRKSPVVSNIFIKHIPLFEGELFMYINK